jgi:hypothetical protein
VTQARILQWLQKGWRPNSALVHGGAGVEESGQACVAPLGTIFKLSGGQAQPRQDGGRRSGLRTLVLEVDTRLGHDLIRF